MSQLPGLASALPAVPVLLTHLAGVVVAVIMLVRHEEPGVASVLALVGFGLPVVLDAASFARGLLIRALSHRTEARIRVAVTSVSCCCSAVHVSASVFLIVAIWRALSFRSTVGDG